jgi:hypothetical protein
MPLTPVPIERFGGLMLAGDPEESDARDMKNVRLDTPGRLITRGGFDTLNSTTQSSLVGLSWFRRSSGGFVNRVYAIQAAAIRMYAAGLATHTDFSSPGDFATSVFTGATAAANDGRMYFARSNTTILSHIGPTVGGWSAIAGSPETYFLTLTGVSSRLVAAYAAIGGSPNRSRVHFSAASDPTTWGATDYVDLWPFDGQQIRAAVTFRDQVFVFKDRRFAIFYGEGTDADGGALFNYRPVDSGIGCAYDHAAATGPDGVYFIATDGIYRTVGDTPVLVSAALQPLFDSATDTDWTGPTSIVTPRLYATQDRLYFVNDSDVFYYRYASGTWARDTYQPDVQFIVQTPTEKPRSFYFIDGTGKACEAGDTFTDDDGTAIAWSYTSGATDLGYPGQVKITQESKLVGSGSVALQVANDYGSFDTGSTVTLGTAPAVADGWQQIDREGTLWQYKLSGSGPARVDRLLHYVRFVKPVGIA